MHELTAQELIQGIYGLTRAINDLTEFAKGFAEAYAKTEVEEEHPLDELDDEDYGERPQSKALRRKKE